MGLCSGGGFAADFEIDFAQLLERAVHAHLHGADRGVEQAGDFLVFEILEAREDEHFAVVVRQAGERGAEEREVVGVGGARVGRGVGVGMLVQVGRIGGGGRGGVFAEMIGGDLAGEMVDLGGEFALVAVGVAVFEDAIEDDLHEVFADGRLVGQAREETVERPVVALEKFAEPGDVTRAHGQHEFVVVGFHGGGDISLGGRGGN